MSGVDLRQKCPPVRDQGQRPTCVAFAATCVHELIRGEDISLSPEFVHWASKQRDGISDYLQGTTLDAACEALLIDGQPSETLWPYDENRDVTLPEYKPTAAAVTEAKLRLLRNHVNVSPQPSDIKNALDLGQPVVLGMVIHDTWNLIGSDGILRYPNSASLELGRHAVAVVGYQDDLFFVRNSWGTAWGDKGYCYITANYIQKYSVAAWAA